MRKEVGLFKVFYKQGETLHLLAKILSPDGETAMKQARALFKQKLVKLSGVELCFENVPIERTVLKKDPA